MLRFACSTRAVQRNDHLGYLTPLIYSVCLAPLITNRYDPVALLAALPATRHFFHPTTKRIHGVEHLIIGVSQDDPGIHPDQIGELSDFLYTLFFQGVAMDFSEFDKTRTSLTTSTQLSSGTVQSTDSEGSLKLEQSCSVERASSTSTPVQPIVPSPGKGGKVAPLL